MMMMTFHESYGHLPMPLLRLVRKYNVSPADYDAILDAFGFTWKDVEHIPGIPSHTWKKVIEFVEVSSQDGYYRPSKFL